ncbi:hypothetical protein AB0067_27540, partial [Klebsiella pneumoniae]
AMTDIIKIMPIEQCKAVSSGCQSYPQDYASRMPGYSWGKPKATAVASYALAQLEAARAKDLATHEANGPAIAANLGVAKRVRAFMEEVGMPASYS